MYLKQPKGMYNSNMRLSLLNSWVKLSETKQVNYNVVRGPFFKFCPKGGPQTHILKTCALQKTRCVSSPAAGRLCTNGATEPSLKEGIPRNTTATGPAP